MELKRHTEISFKTHKKTLMEGQRKKKQGKLQR